MVDAVAIVAARNGGATRKPSLGESLVRARYKYIPDHVLGEILTKRWIDNVAPFTFLVITVALFGYLIPDFFSPASLVVSLRQLGEYGPHPLAGQQLSGVLGDRTRAERPQARHARHRRHGLVERLLAC